MKKILLFFILCLSLLMTSCRTKKMVTVPINNDSIVLINNNDSTVIRYKDSTVISYKDSTIYTEIPVERYINYAKPVDTLYMETSVAWSRTYLDTELNMLRGEISNKDNAVLEKTVYLPSKEHVVYKDSIRTISNNNTKTITREIPVEVQIETIKTKYPNLFWYLLIYTICSIFAAGCYIYIKCIKK